MEVAIHPIYGGRSLLRYGWAETQNQCWTMRSKSVQSAQLALKRNFLKSCALITDPLLLASAMGQWLD